MSDRSETAHQGAAEYAAELAGASHGAATLDAPAPISPAAGHASVLALRTHTDPAAPARRPMPPDQALAAARRSAILVHAIEQRIVPRLALARAAAATEHQPRPEAADAVRLVALLLGDDIAAAANLLEQVRGRGVALERIYLDLLAPAARRLGTMWEEDAASFADVTIALSRLQRLLHDFSPSFVRARERLLPARRVLLTPLPGEQHRFGHSMLCEFFRRAGWDVAGEPLDDAGALLAIVGRDWFQVVGISLGCRDRLPELAVLIRAVRRAALNPGLGVMVGGQAFHGRPELVLQVGADATAADASDAPARAEAMLGMLATPS